MPRYRVTLEYDGTPFVGWQVQALGRLGAGPADRGDRQVLRRDGLACAGPAARTPACMRWARSRISTLRRAWPVDTVRAAVNFHLKPDPIAVLDCAVVADDFDARFSATARHYRYRILSRPAPPVLDRDRVWWVPQPMHVEAMQAGAEIAGRPARLHDVSRRRLPGQVAGQDARPPGGARPAARRSVSTPRRARSCTTRCARWWARSSWSARASGARRISGAALQARDRAACGPVAPARGLYLVRVDYAAAGGLQPR